MVDSVLWKGLSESQLLDLEATTEPEMCRELLRSFFDLSKEADDKVRGVLEDFYFYNYAFGRDAAFNLRKLSVFMEIMHQLLLWDTQEQSGYNDSASSFERFKALLFLHSVERSPKSTGIFTRDDAHKVVDFVLDSYYRHYMVYKCIFTGKARTVLQQSGSSGTAEQEQQSPPDDGLLPEEPDSTGEF